MAFAAQQDTPMLELLRDLLNWESETLIEQTMTHISVTYFSNRASRLITRQSAEGEYEFEMSADDTRVVTITRENDKRVIADLDQERVWTQKGPGKRAVYVGELEDLNGLGRFHCTGCNEEVEGGLNLVGPGSGDAIHAVCPECNGRAEYFTA